MHPTLSKRTWWRDQRFKLPVPRGSLQAPLQAVFSNLSCNDETLLFSYPISTFSIPDLPTGRVNHPWKDSPSSLLVKCWFFNVFCEAPPGNKTESAFRNPHRNFSNRSNYNKSALSLSLTHKICAFQKYFWSLQESDCLNERKEVHKQLEPFFL